MTPALAQNAVIENAGVYVDEGSAFTVNGTLYLDSLALVENLGKVTTKQTETFGTIRLLGDSSQWEIDSILSLLKGNFFLSKNTLIIHNKDTFALQTDEGELIVGSDTSKGNLRWYIGNNTGKYVIPFKTIDSNDVSIEFDVINAGSDSGFIDFYTYATDPVPDTNNSPRPITPTYFFENYLDSISLNLVDRFWLVKPGDYDAPPLANVSLKYLDDDLAGQNNIVEDSLYAYLINQSGFNILFGEADTASNQFTLDSVSNLSDFTLSSGSICSDVQADFNVESGTIYLMDTIELISTGIGGNLYEWYLNNYLVSTDTSFQYTFVTTHTYTVRLNVIDTVAGCFDFKEVALQVVRHPRPFISNSAHNVNGVSPMYVTDRFGNSVLLDDIRVQKNSEAAGIFLLHFVDDDDTTQQGFDDETCTPIPTWCTTCLPTPACPGQTEIGAVRRAVVRQVFTDLSRLLSSNGLPSGLPNVYGITPTTNPWIDIEVKESGLIDNNTAVVGVAAQWHLDASNGISFGVIWKAITTGFDPYWNLQNQSFLNAAATNYYHGYLKFNFDNHVFDIDPTASVITNNDLYIVSMHEAIHLLGFGSGIDDNAQSAFPGNHFTPYDTYLTTSSGTPLLVNNDGGVECYDWTFNPLLSSTDLEPGCTTPIEFDGINLTNQAVYSPNPFAEGSSLSHFNCPSSGCGNAAYIMNYCGQIGSFTRVPKLEEVQALCDLGYDLTGQLGYSNGQSLPYATYTNYCNSPRIVAGVNDFAPFPAGGQLPAAFYSILPGQSIDILYSDIRANDINDNTDDFDAVQCLAFVSPAPTSVGLDLDPDVLSDQTTIRVTVPFYFSGDAVLRYRPKNSNGDLGDMTYIFIKVNHDPLAACDPTDCIAVCHGGFEDFDRDDLGNISNFRITNGNTPDIYTYDGNDTRNGVGNTSSGFGCSTNQIPNPHNSNNFTYIGVACHQSNQEAVTFELNRPMVAGGLYEISFWGHGKDASCLAQYDIYLSVNAPCTLNTGGDWDDCGTTFTQAGSRVTLTTSWAQHFVSPPFYQAADNFRYITIVGAPLSAYGYIDDININVHLSHPAGLTITQNTTWSTQSFSFGDDLVIQTGATLIVRQNSILSFARLNGNNELVNIIVQPGAQLIVDKSTLRGLPACNEMWGGVEVGGNSSLQQANANQGKMIIRNSSILRDALTGVLLARRNTNGTIVTGSGGGIFQALSSNFTNNKVAVQMEPYTGGFGASITNCVFTCDGSYLEPQAEKLHDAFIKMRGVNGKITIYNSRFRFNAAYPATPASGYTPGDGIYAVHSDFLLSGNRFTRLYYGVIVYGLPHTLPGVRTFIAAGNNQFVNNYKGFSTLFVGGTISANTFTVPLGTALPQIGATTETFGLELIIPLNMTVQGNTFTGTAGGDPNCLWCSQGLKIQDAGTIFGSSLIFDNSFEKTEVGLAARGANTQLTLRCNRFAPDGSDHPRTAWAMLRKPGTFVMNAMRNQGSPACNNDPTAAAGNKWFTNDVLSFPGGYCTGHDTRDVSQPTQIVPFNYYHHNRDMDGNQKPRPECSDATWRNFPHLFPCALDENAASCQNLTNQLAFHLVISDPNSMDEYRSEADTVIAENEAAKDSLASEMDAVDSQFDGGNTEALIEIIDDAGVSNLDLVDSLLDNSPLSDTVLKKILFRPSMNSALIWKVMQINVPLSREVFGYLLEDYSPLSDALKDSIKLKQQTEAAYDSLRLLYTTLREKWRYADDENLLITNELLRHYSYLQDSMPDAFDELLEQSPYIEHKKALCFRYLHNSTRLATLLDSINDASDDWYSYEHEVFGDAIALLKEMTLSDSAYYYPDSIHLATLQELADDSASHAVVARTILAEITDTTFEYPFEYSIDTSSKRAMESRDTFKVASDKITSFFKLYPNPNDGSFIIEYETKEDHTRFEVYDILGKRRYFLLLPKGSNKQVIASAELTNGCYLYRYRSEREIFNSGRIIILKP